jgi:hypothetical protein
MSKSPLSGAFAGSSRPAKKNKKNGALLLISGIALATSIGGVFAANSITINSNADIEFGQGVVEATSCVSALTFTVTQEFVPETSAGAGDAYFKIDDLTATGDFSDCAVGTELILTARKADGTAVGVGAASTVEVVASASAADEVEAAAGQTVTIALGSQNLDAGLLSVVTATTE